MPSLVLSYTGDNAIFPSDAQAAYAALGAPDKQIASAPGDHYGFGVGTQERTGAPLALAHDRRLAARAVPGVKHLTTQWTRRVSPAP